MTREAEILERIENLTRAITAMTAQHAALTTKVGEMKAHIETLERKQDETKEVVEAYAAAKTTLKFAKWLAGFVAALFAIVAAMKGYWHK